MARTPAARIASILAVLALGAAGTTALAGPHDDGGSRWRAERSSRAQHERWDRDTRSVRDRRPWHDGYAPRYRREGYPYGYRHDGRDYRYGYGYRDGYAYRGGDYRRHYRRDDGRDDDTALTIAGGVIGGLIGNHATSPENRAAGTVFGAVIGGVLGHAIGQSNNDDRSRRGWRDERYDRGFRGR